ncbi:hypothetical protein LV779_12380 [Streptomyces thinghirensis]|nr:hypothetical protein [Streptomyces thinghirensis]
MKLAAEGRAIPSDGKGVIDDLAGGDSVMTITAQDKAASSSGVVDQVLYQEGSRPGRLAGSDALDQDRPEEVAAQQGA